MRIRVRCPRCPEDVALLDFEPVPGAKPPNLNIALCPVCGVRVQTRFFAGWKHESRVVSVTANGAGSVDVRLSNNRQAEAAKRRIEWSNRPAQPPRLAPLPRSKEVLMRAGGV